MINGFRVELISFEEVAKHFNRNLLSVDNKNALFLAEQLQLSDDQVVQFVMTSNGYLLFGIKNVEAENSSFLQMESWRREFQRLEDEGDEEGFEDW